MPLSKSDNAMLAKIHCLFGKRLNAEDYGQLLQKRTVSEIAGYLKNETYFSDILSEVKEDMVHREQIENLIERRILEIYLRLSKYSHSDRIVQNMYSAKSEIEQILFAMRLLNAGNMDKFIISLPTYLANHMSFDLFGLARAKSYDDLLAVINHTEYYNIVGRFRPVTNDRQVNIPECETALLAHYYNKLFAVIHEKYTGSTRENLETLLRYQIDLHNISVIYRMKKYFKATPQSIAKLLIPSRGKLSPQTYGELLAAPDYQSLTGILVRRPTSYFGLLDTTASTEQVIFQIERIKKRISQRLFRFSIQPVVAVISYMTLLEIEASNIVNIIEGVRYELAQDEIRAMLVL